jgi:hypothetical protein
MDFEDTPCETDFTSGGVVECVSRPVSTGITDAQIWGDDEWVERIVILSDIVIICVDVGGKETEGSEE